MNGNSCEVETFFQAGTHRQSPAFTNANGGGGDDVPIDPGLNSISVDPALLGTGEGAPGQATPPPVIAPQPKIAQFRQYPQGPQGDPFAPQASPSYLPVEVPTPPSVVKPPKKKQLPQREEECGFCQGNDSRNKHGQAERMVSCAECGRSTHPSCLNLANVCDVMHSYAWLCHNCKRCEVCRKNEGENKMILCEHCDRGWHMDCLQPPLDEEPPGQWYCPLCQASFAQVALLPTPADMYHPTKLPPHTLSSSPHSILGPEHPTKLPPEHTAYRASSVASSSRLTDARGRDPAAATDESEADGDAVANPAVSWPKSKKKQRVKGKTPMRDDPEPDARSTPTARPQKRARVRLTTPSPPPTQKMGSGLRIRLPFRDKGKGREEDDMPKGMFDDILSPEDRDTAETSILPVDKQRFERSRVAAEDRLYPRPPPAQERQETPGAGPSRPLRSSHRQVPVPPPLSERSESPARSTPGPQTLKPPDKLRIRRIRFGGYDIETWFDAPFPEEYANIPDGRLWYCEFCLKYMKSKFLANRHLMKCKMRFPPGDEIYRDGPISIFEVDGRKNKIYCQNLCLLSKMFLDHKSLFYDVEPFLFYVITEFDDVGSRFVGYFSKEKRSPKDYNVSCIMTLPIRQRQGWGQLLIDFSYLLSKKEGRPGSPEKPLSPLGAIGYKKYWAFALQRYLHGAPPNPRLEDIQAATAMTVEDIYNTLVQLRMVRVDDPLNRPKPVPGQAIKVIKGRKNGIARKHLQRKDTQDDEKVKGPFVVPTVYEIHWDPEEVEQFLTGMEAKSYVTLKPERLKWSPFIVARTRKTDQLPSSDATTVVEDVQAKSGPDAIPTLAHLTTPTPGPLLDVRDSSVIPSKSPFSLFDNDNVVKATSPSRGVSKEHPETDTRQPSTVVPDSSSEGLQPGPSEKSEDRPMPVSGSESEVPQEVPQETHCDEQAQLEQDLAYAQKLAREEEKPARSLRSRGQSEARPDDTRLKTLDDSPSLRKSRPASFRRTTVRMTASVSPVKGGTRRVSQDEHDEATKRSLRSRATTEPDVRREVAPKMSLSPRKRRRVESPQPEIEMSPSPLTHRNSRRGGIDDTATATPRSQKRPTRWGRDATPAFPSPSRPPRGSTRPVGADAAYDEVQAPSEPNDVGDSPVEDLQYDRANTPLTGVTSRHSVPSEDTVVVTPTAGDTNKISPVGVVVSMHPTMTVEEEQPIQGSGVDTMDIDVDADEKDDDYADVLQDEDAEGEPDDAGEPEINHG